MQQDDSIFVAGHRGLVGSAIVRRLKASGFANLFLPDRSELDLTEQGPVTDFFREVRPRYVFLAAAKVGGILSNMKYPAEFLHQNVSIENNAIHAAYQNGCEKLLFLGSSCIYPRAAAQPMVEDCLLTGPFEPTNEGYALAKVVGIKLCQTYRQQYGFRTISLIPPNVYGPGDNFSLAGSHVVAALLRKVHEARNDGADEVEVWGTGMARREFMHVDDLADACLFLMREYEGSDVINVGWGNDVSVAELAATIQKVVGFEGRLQFDVSKPDGIPQKLLDVTRLALLGWQPRIDLETGIRSTYAWFLENRASLRD